MTPIGVPYARTEIDDEGNVLRVCPVCDERIHEPVDDDHKPLRPLYAEHYLREHERKLCACGDELVDGVDRAFGTCSDCVGDLCAEAHAECYPILEERGKTEGVFWGDFSEEGEKLRALMPPEHDGFVYKYAYPGFESWSSRARPDLILFAVPWDEGQEAITLSLQTLDGWVVLADEVVFSSTPDIERDLTDYLRIVSVWANKFLS